MTQKPRGAALREPSRVAQLYAEKLMKTKVLMLATVLLLVSLAWHKGWIHSALALKGPLLEACRVHPVLLFAAIAILPGCAFPAAPLFILAGAVWGANPGTCAVTLAAAIINISWTHAVAAGFGQKFIQRILGKYWDAWKSKTGSHDWRLAAALRLTPGIPLFAQNYLLGLIGMPLRHSIVIAIPTTGLYVCGFVLTGGAIFEGNIGLCILGLALLLVTSYAVKKMHQRLAQRRVALSDS